MCSTGGTGVSGTSLMPYGLKLPPGAVTGTTAYPGVSFTPAGLTQAAMELQRAQLYEYNARAMRYAMPYGPAMGMGHPYHPALSAVAGVHDPLHAYLYAKQDPRTRFLHEEPKPSHSYIGLISMAILGSKDKKLVLSEIYQWILDNYAYFRSRGPGWRNSIRHNLSLNDCFIKSGRSANGKGHYWAVHPANVEDFSKGDFRRRRAQRKVRKAMGMAVPDDEDSPSPSPPAPSLNEWRARIHGEPTPGAADSIIPPRLPQGPHDQSLLMPETSPVRARVAHTSRKRLFDVESLLAPDTDTDTAPPPSKMAVFPASSRSPPASREVEEEEEVVIEEDVCDVGEEVRPADRTSPAGSLHQDTLSPVPLSSPQSHSPGLRSPGSSPGVDSRPSWAAQPTTTLCIPRPAQPGDRTNSAFHSALPPAAWGAALHPQMYPTLLTGTPYQIPAAMATASSDSAQKWQETFSRIMARSYDKNLKLKS